MFSSVIALGGLVARRYLLDEYKNGVDARVTDLLLYGTPNIGTGLARVARYISWFHPQLKQLVTIRISPPDLNRNRNTLTAGKPICITAVIGGSDDVVLEESARGLWGNGNVKVVVSATHVDLVKPAVAKIPGI